MKLVIEKNPEKRLSPEQRKVKMGKGFIYHESRQPLYRVKVLMRNLETEPELYVNRVEKRIYQIHRLINFLKRLEDIEKGMLWIHAGAVADQDQKGILLTGIGDVGKTTLILLLARLGYYILGDDIVKISKDGSIIRLQETAGIFPHPGNLKNLPLSLREKVVGWSKYHFIKPPLTQFIYPNLGVDYGNIGKILDSARLEKIYVLEKGTPSLYQINQKEGIRKILATSLNLFLPTGFPKTFFYDYCFANDFSPTFIEDKYKEILNSVLKEKKCFVLRGQPPLDFYKLFLEHERKQT